MNGDLRQDTRTESLNMKRLLFPLLTLLVLGQLVYLFTAFDVSGAAGDLLERLHLTLQAKVN